MVGATSLIHLSDEGANCQELLFNNNPWKHLVEYHHTLSGTPPHRKTYALRGCPKGKTYALRGCPKGKTYALRGCPEIQDGLKNRMAWNTGRPKPLIYRETSAKIFRVNTCRKILQKPLIYRETSAQIFRVNTCRKQLLKALSGILLLIKNKTNKTNKTKQNKTKQTKQNPWKTGCPEKQDALKNRMPWKTGCPEIQDALRGRILQKPLIYRETSAQIFRVHTCTKILQKPLIYRETSAQIFKENTCKKFYKNPIKRFTRIQKNLRRGKKNKISKTL